ncbi:MAG: hypothetical protein RM347_023920 [Nostoc sp. ChiQUE02]
MINLGLGRIAHNVECCIPSFFAYTLKLTDRSERKGAIATISHRKMWGLETGDWGLVTGKDKYQ